MRRTPRLHASTTKAFNNGRRCPRRMIDTGQQLWVSCTHPACANQHHKFDLPALAERFGAVHDDLVRLYFCTECREQLRKRSESYLKRAGGPRQPSLALVRLPSGHAGNCGGLLAASCDPTTPSLRGSPPPSKHSQCRDSLSSVRVPANSNDGGAISRVDRTCSSLARKN